MSKKAVPATLIDNLRAYLKMVRKCDELEKNIGLTFADVVEFVITFGVECEFHPRPKGIRKMAAKACFHNAAMLAMKQDLVYVEGFVGGHAIPIHHAWCVAKGSRIVIDPTIDGASYWGVPLTKEYVLSDPDRIGESLIDETLLKMKKKAQPTVIEVL